MLSEPNDSSESACSCSGSKTGLIVGSSTRTSGTQAIPKGNFFSKFLTYLDEMHLRQFRAIPGAASVADWPEESRSFEGLRQAVLKSGVSASLYDRLHALAAAIYAQYACGETGPNGRARVEPLQVVSPAEFAAHGVRLPRHVVAAVASQTICHATTHRLALTEAGRVEQASPRTFALLHGWHQGVAVVLKYVDGMGYGWQPSTEVLPEAKAELAALSLIDFGLPSVPFESLSEVPSQFLLCSHGDHGLSLRHVPPSARAPSSYNTTLRSRQSSNPALARQHSPAFVDSDAALSLRLPPDGGKKTSWGGASSLLEARRAYAEEMGLDATATMKRKDRTIRTHLQSAYEERLIRQQRAQAARAGRTETPRAPPDTQLSKCPLSYMKEQEAWAEECGAQGAFDELDLMGGSRAGTGAEGSKRQRRFHVLMLAWARWRATPAADRTTRLPLQHFRLKRTAHPYAEVVSGAQRSSDESRPQRSSDERRPHRSPAVQPEVQRWSVKLMRINGSLGISIDDEYYVTEVRSGGAADREGSIHVGDLITKIAGERTETLNVPISKLFPEDVDAAIEMTLSRQAQQDGDFPPPKRHARGSVYAESDSEHETGSNSCQSCPQSEAESAAESDVSERGAGQCVRRRPARARGEERDKGDSCLACLGKHRRHTCGKRLFQSAATLDCRPGGSINNAAASVSGHSGANSSADEDTEGEASATDSEEEAEEATARSGAVAGALRKGSPGGASGGRLGGAGPAVAQGREVPEKGAAPSEGAPGGPLGGAPSGVFGGTLGGALAVTLSRVVPGEGAPDGMPGEAPAGASGGALSTAASGAAMSTVSVAACTGEAARSTTAGKRKELLEDAEKASKRLRRKECCPRAFNAAGEEMPYVRTEVRRMLNSIDRHILECVGQQMRVTQLKGVIDAAAEVKKVLQPANKWRATSLDDALMNEGWLVLDPAYAADSFLMGITAFGEAMGPRASDYYAALLMHFVMAITGTALDWDRFSGKNNQKAEKRRRRLGHRTGCACDEPGCPDLWLESTACESDETGMLPETRCGCCALRRLFALMGPGSPTRVAFLRLSHKAKFSWEKDAMPMEKLEDGSYDGAEWFRTDQPTKSVTVRMLNTMFRKWGAQMNVRRKDLGMPELDLDLFRSHSIRHGAARNFKRMGCDLDSAAAHLCMSRDVLERIYGLEDATVSGGRLTGQIVGSSSRGL